MKYCNGCKQTKDESEFSKDRSKKCGLGARCRECRKAYYERNREAKKDYRQQNRKKLRDYARERGRMLRRQDPEGVRVRKRDYERNRWVTDIQFATAVTLRVRMNAAIAGGTKSGSAVSDLGMSIDEFTAYIESLWLPGMTWENRGRDGWHLDHIYPLSKADLTDRSQFLAVANWQNYQPMWGDENIVKNDTVTPEAQALFDRLVKHFQEQLEKEEAA